MLGPRLEDCVAPEAQDPCCGFHSAKRARKKWLPADLRMVAEARTSNTIRLTLRELTTPNGYEEQRQTGDQSVCTSDDCVERGASSV